MVVFATKTTFMTLFIFPVIINFNWLLVLSSKSSEFISLTFVGCAEEKATFDKNSQEVLQILP